MLAPTILMLVGAFPAPSPFTTPLAVAQTNRIALTPVLDGKLDPEEWDELAEIDGGKAYFQWEPQVMHFAVTAPAGKDVLISCDLRADGWLIGKDNLEIRLRKGDSGVDVQTRILDGTQASGPQWSEATAFQSSAKAVASSSDLGWTVELTLRDPGKMMLIKDASRPVGLRVDTVSSEEGSAEPFLPRTMSNLSLGLDRTQGLPEGLNFKPEYKGRSVVPGSKTRIRLTFNGKTQTPIKRIEMRTEGLSRDATGTTGFPFPAFDAKGRAYVDYETSITPDASPGYRVLRATVTDAEGKESLVQSSFEIAPSVDFELVPLKDLKAGADPRKTKFVVYVRSNTLRRVDGIFNVVAPDGWKIGDGNGEPFIIYNARGSVRRVVEATIPADAHGPFPIKFQANLGNKVIEQTVWITVP